ncbi:zinc finger MYM-type protein 1-like protein [Tanacetum coccineum]
MFIIHGGKLDSLIEIRRGDFNINIKLSSDPQDEIRRTTSDLTVSNRNILSSPSRGLNGRMRKLSRSHGLKGFWWMEYSVVDKSRDESKKEQMAIVVILIFTQFFVQQDFRSGKQDVNANHVNDPPEKDVHNSMTVNLDSLIRDPDARPSILILSYPSDHQDEIRRDYIRLGRGSDERPVSKNQGNLLELVKLIASYNKDVENVDVQNIRGQGYNGASNMCGEWNGLQALILKECPYAYYVHCFAHQLQLALVSASKEVAEEIMEITDKLYQALQPRLQDIVNTLALVSTTKTLLQKLIDEGWDSLMVELNSKFNESVTELLRLTVALDLRKSSNIDDICKLMMKDYPSNFIGQEKI